MQLRSMIVCVSLLAPHVSFAQEADEVPICAERSASEFIHVAVCDERLPDEVLAAEGQRICGEKLPCGVWFWQVASDAPDVAPDNHDGLTQAELASSQGVWVGERSIFIRIEPVE
ncbi:MAG: hypothetical protein ABNH38_20870 [Tateyamaria sp.]|jgi:hypothetical protein|uniref:hypothetical protein n=1 Tax=Tateyamaria sp. TaxID=1929288 RepID=UPI0032DDEBA7